MLLGLAAGVGFSRVYLGHHFPSDVLIGASMGWLIGKLGAGLLLREEPH
jgi:membrane-associated phospholipid phosphatase